MNTVAPGASYRATPRNHVWAFLACVCLFACAADVLRIHLDHQNTMLDRFAMWGPGASTLVTCWIYRIDVRTLGWHWPKKRWLMLSYFLPLLYATPVYLVTWIAVDKSFALDSFMESVAGSYNLAQWKVFGTFVVGMPLLLTVGMLSGLVWALGEELGWRGFLFPRLMSRYGFNGACLISGLAWAVWHYPGLIWGHYNAGTNVAFELACFTLMVVALAFVMGWLRCRSHSVWPCALLHASHNLMVQAIFDPLTSNTGLARYATTEFGLGLVVTTAITAFILCTRPSSPSRRR
jgi:membrane protease YdiL (CAAX protease family)